MTKIKKAIELLCQRAEQYSKGIDSPLKQYAYFLVSRKKLDNEDEPFDEFERDSTLPDGLYCEDCMPKLITKLSKSYPKKEIDCEIDNDSYDYFQRCESCGDTFDLTVFPDKEELEHWNRKDMSEVLKEDRDFYELHNILSEVNCNNEYENIVKNIAKKVVKFLTVSKLKDKNTH